MSPGSVDPPRAMERRDPAELERALSESLGTATQTRPGGALRALELTIERGARHDVRAYRLDAVFAGDGGGALERVALEAWSSDLADADVDHWHRVDRWARARAEGLRVPFRVNLAGD